MDKSTRGFLLVSAIFVLIFLAAINLLVFPDQHWALYTSLLLLSPFYFILGGDRHLKLYTVIAALFLLVVLAFSNYLETPDYPWILYVMPAVCAWPIVILGGQKSGTAGYSLFWSLVLVFSYIALNVFFEPAFLFSIFTTFGIMWWPLSVGLAKYPRGFSIIAAVWMTIFFIVANFVTTETVWWIYPVTAIWFWPLVMFLLPRHLTTFSFISTGLVVTFFVTVNILTTPDIIWAIYPIFAIIWWPLAIFFFVYKRRKINRPFL
ncbi:hypothetical protein [Listeria ilorinensis]|uniref:hypothetical protein n=1 Tax=Listeria ilorinensis TaxID=2867439 RepID=UPI001EF41D37|nr:hypothetical protein [Listeria ilorinensis]